MWKSKTVFPHMQKLKSITAIDKETNSKILETKKAMELHFEISKKRQGS